MLKQTIAKAVTLAYDLHQLRAQLSAGDALNSTATFDELNDSARIDDALRRAVDLINFTCADVMVEMRERRG